MQAIANQIDGLFFFLVYGHGKNGKTHLQKTILPTVKSQEKITLAIVSLGIASLLLPRGKTTHSRFHIPINIFDKSTCEIKRGMQAQLNFC